MHTVKRSQSPFGFGADSHSPVEVKTKCGIDCLNRLSALVLILTGKGGTVSRLIGVWV